MHQHIQMHFQNGIFQLQVHLLPHGILLNRNHALCLLSQLLKCPALKFRRRCRTFLRPILTVWLQFLPQLFWHNLEPLLWLFHHLPYTFQRVHGCRWHIFYPYMRRLDFCGLRFCRTSFRYWDF